MFKRLRTTWMAGSGALLLVLALSGVVAGASFLAATGPAQETADPEVVDTTATWQDANGNGIDDDCEEAAVVADLDAEALADAAVDTDGDGVISVTEAAHSDRVGGTNCNHGGYVSFVANGEAETADEDAAEPAAELDDAGCEEVAAPEADATVTTPNAHGTWISQVAQSDAVGGKNCNHGGAVSEANKAAREAREVAKDAKAAERASTKAERAAARAAARAERSAAKADKPSQAERSAKSAAARAERSAAKADKPINAAKAKPAKTKSAGN